jgi:hypothetical protein
MSDEENIMGLLRVMDPDSSGIDSLFVKLFAKGMNDG